MLAKVARPDQCSEMSPTLYIIIVNYIDLAKLLLLRSCWSSNFVEKAVLNESMVAKMISRVSYVVYYCIYRLNLNKLSQNCVGALRTTTNCKVMFW